jgi:hypothetical protein
MNDRYTYFIQIKDSIRVGSAVRIKGKIETLREHYKNPLTVIAVVPEAMAEPDKVYELFARLKVRRGWLRSNPELVYFIEGMKPYFVDPEQLELDRTKLILSAEDQAEHDIVSDLMSLRNIHGAKSDIGHGISNVLEQIPAMKSWRRQPWMTDVRQTLPWMLNQQLERIARLKVAAISAAV